jgi:hypothetical protein
MYLSLFDSVESVDLVKLAILVDLSITRATHYITYEPEEERCFVRLQS